MGKKSAKSVVATKSISPWLRHTPQAHAEQYCATGNAYQAQGQFEQALAQYTLAIQYAPQHTVALFYQGLMLQNLKRWQEALKVYSQLITLKPDFAKTYVNRGVVQHELKQYALAVQDFNKAIALNDTIAEAYANRALSYQALGQPDLAMADYEQSLARNPQDTLTWVNKGLLLHAKKAFTSAIDCYTQAITIQPSYADAYANRAVSYQSLIRYDEALHDFNQALHLKPNQPHIVLFNRGELLRIMGRFVEAQTDFRAVWHLNPDVDFLLGNMVHNDAYLCDWQYFPEQLKQLAEDVRARKNSGASFELSSFFDDPALQRQAAEIWVAHHIKVLRENITPLATHPPHGKIRLGYFSADFRQHPVAYLTAELFELHDRNQFEVIGFYWGEPCTDAIRARLEAGFDQFIDLEKLSDEQAVALARRMQLDIAIDLGGHTQDCRTELFAHRIAPIQVNYLGYPGTMGADFMDYLLADSQLIDAETRAEYHEKIAYLPSYQPNDSQRMMNTEAVSRSQYGLPESGIVFCCFNKPYKIMPEVFASWMRILQAVPKSVLWLSPAHHLAMRNLRQSATQQGVDGERIVFAIRTETTAEHLARHRLADLFLDTLPYNAHTTASDALWAGLPLITLRGKSFTSRVASSLLTAIGLPELITHTRADYEALAIRLAQNPAELSALKSKLIAHRQQYPLFNSTQYTRHLEQAYRTMYQRQQQGLPPADVAVSKMFS